MACWLEGDACQCLTSSGQQSTEWLLMRDRVKVVSSSVHQHRWLEAMMAGVMTPLCDRCQGKERYTHAASRAHTKCGEGMRSHHRMALLPFIPDADMMAVLQHTEAARWLARMYSVVCLCARVTQAFGKCEFTYRCDVRQNPDRRVWTKCDEIRFPRVTGNMLSACPLVVALGDSPETSLMPENTTNTSLSGCL